MPTASPAKKTTPAAAAPQLPDGIEIFRAGTREDSNGVLRTITQADIAAAAAAYDPAVHEVPIVVGHPKHDAPAYGWVKRIHANGDVLTADAHQVDVAFAEMVQAGRFKKRSLAFYQPMDPANPKPGIWYPRHVAYLGAEPPAVKGLRDINFSEGDGFEAVCFSEPVSVPNPTPVTTDPQEPDDMSKELQDKLDKAEAALKASQEATAKAEASAKAAKELADKAQAEAAAFSERARANRTAGFVAFAEAQVQAGKLLPKDKDMAVATMESLADTAPVEFSEGDTVRKVARVEWLQGLIANSAASVDFSERAGGAMPATGGSAKGKTDAEIDRAAKDYAAKNKVSYADAVKAVTA
ncbi:hypothetical protein [Paracidovorax wautersii]|uniref:hypothetical protein n=1 Tax=Paracidovorax wautersii TaxID=1177982 RepID=UPI0031CE9535